MGIGTEKEERTQKIIYYLNILTSDVKIFYEKGDVVNKKDVLDFVGSSIESIEGILSQLTALSQIYDSKEE